MRWVERAAWGVGIAATGLWMVLTAAGYFGARRELQTFAAYRAGEPMRPADLAGPVRVDQRLWSPERMEAWRATLRRDAPAALAVLRVPRVGVEAPVLPGTDEWTLNRAVGHIDQTALPGADGNAGIAGHRDGFFRALKDVQIGDRVDLETTRERQTYRVDQVWIVDPSDVWVLDPTPARSLTLVTCYPFYFIGSAPRRFIVRAVLVRPATS
jgi:sortase A